MLSDSKSDISIRMFFQSEHSSKCSRDQNVHKNVHLVRMFRTFSLWFWVRNFARKILWDLIQKSSQNLLH